jgi:hypothetical protein
MKAVFCTFFLCLAFHMPGLRAQEIILYDLRDYQIGDDKTIAFISLSDKDKLLDSPDSMAVNDLIDTARCLKLQGDYRKRFFAETGFKETDTVFIYDYSENILVSVSVKNLKLVACLNVYKDDLKQTYTQSDYMIGLEVDKKSLAPFKNNYTRNTLVSVGAKSPFIRKKLNPVLWKKIEPAGYIPETINTLKDTVTMNRWFAKYVIGSAYMYSWGDFQYFVREFVLDKRVVARHVLVINQRTNKTAYENTYYETEGSSPAPLNFVEGEGYTLNQWTGDLFKNKPPVIFGFTYVDFGCPNIDFLNPQVTGIGINCDNRH